MKKNSLFHVAFGLYVLVFLLSGFADRSAAQEQPAKADKKLRWSPPKLENPVTITLGEGVTSNTLDKTKDYIVKLPAKRKVGATILEGGRNIVIIGGYITVPTGNKPQDINSRAIYIKNAEGTVHIEGVLIDNSGNSDFDGIAICAPSAVVQIQNCRIMGLTGLFKGTHSDIVQPWGGVKELRIDRLTGSSNYQGLFIPQDLAPIGSAVISHVDMKALPNSYHPNGTYLLWFTKDQDGNSVYPITFEEVYIIPLEGRTAGQTVWPHVKSPQAIAAVQNGKEISWPTLKSVKGVVTEGAPPGGEFVPEGVAGLDYSSPGYETSKE